MERAKNVCTGRFDSQKSFLTKQHLSIAIFLVLRWLDYETYVISYIYSFQGLTRFSTLTVYYGLTNMRM